MLTCVQGHCCTKNTCSNCKLTLHEARCVCHEKHVENEASRSLADSAPSPGFLCFSCLPFIFQVFLYCPRTKNSLYTSTLLGGRGTEECFVTHENYMKFKFMFIKFDWNIATHTTSFADCLWLLLC